MNRQLSYERGIIRGPEDEWEDLDDIDDQDDLDDLDEFDMLTEEDEFDELEEERDDKTRRKPIEDDNDDYY